MYTCMVVFLCVEINKFVIFDHISLLENNLASVLEQISLKIHGKPSILLSRLVRSLQVSCIVQAIPIAAFVKNKFYFDDILKINDNWS